MSFFQRSRLLSGSEIDRRPRSSSDRPKRSSRNRARKRRSNRVGFEPLEQRQLLSINPVLVINTQNIAETLVNPGTPAASNDRPGNQIEPAIAIEPLTNNGTTATAATRGVIAWETASGLAET